MVGRIKHGADARDHRDQVALGQGIDHVAFDARGDIGRLVERVVGGQLEFEVDRVGEIRGEKAERHDPRRNESGDEEQSGEENRNHGVARAQGEIEQMGVNRDRFPHHAVDRFAQFFVAQAQLIAQAVPSARRVGCRRRPPARRGADRSQTVGQMRGENEKGLRERKAKRGNDDHRHNSEKFADDALAPDERKERSNRCAHAAEDRPYHFLGPAHRGPCCALAFRVIPENIFSDDNGVVDHHAQRHDHAEQRKHVDGESPEIKNEKCAGEGKRNAEGDEQREAPIKEEKKQNGDEDERLDAVFGYSFDARVDVFGRVGHDLCLDFRRKGRGFLGKNLTSFPHGLDDIGPLLLHQRVGDSGSQIGATIGLRLLGCFFYGGDVADLYRAAVGPLDHRQILELRGLGDLAEQPDDALSALRIEASTDHVDVFRRHGVHDLGEGETGRAQAVGIDLDPHFAPLQSVDQHPRNAGHEFEFALDAVERGTDFADVEPRRIGSGESDEREGDVELLDDRRLG